jgi:cell division protein ZapA
MAQAVVSIAGRTYRMNCDEGEEPHIESLARMVDAKISELRGAFGEIGEQRITVMAALTIADELVNAEKKLALAVEAAEKAQIEADDCRRREADWAAAAAVAIDEAAEQIEAATRALGAEKG